MAHQQQVDFCTSVQKRFPEFFENRLVLDIGSFDINGNNQYLFSNCQYFGIDLNIGRNVDFASKGHEFGLPDASVDVVISTECFEHDQFYGKTIANAIRMLKPGGLFIFTCATTGRPEHGTRRTTPQDAPFTMDFGEWGDYYKNLEAKDILAVVDVENIFRDHQFSTNLQTFDLYFWGIKKGTLATRHDYSFQIKRASSEDHVENLDVAVKRLETSLASSTLALQSAINDGRKERETVSAALVLEQARHNALQSEHAATLQALEVHQRKTAEASQHAEILEQRITALSAEHARVNAALLAATRRNEQITADLQQTQANLARIVASKSWRLTRPVRFAARLLRGEFATAMTPLASGRFGSKVRLLGRAGNGLRYLLRGDFGGFAKRLSYLNREADFAAQTGSAGLGPGTANWCIVTTSHTRTLAQAIAARLATHGWISEVMERVPTERHHDWYIVLCPQMFSDLPPGEKRIVFQLEQSVSSRWFTPAYFAILENSRAVLEYSAENMRFLAGRGIVFPHVHYLPIGASVTPDEANDAPQKEWDVLFYGDSLSSERRRTLLNALKKEFSLHIINDSFGPELHAAIRRAKLVINLHYYENALLETPRIQECLTLGVPVVSEAAQDQHDYPELAQVVRYFEEGSVEKMLIEVRQALKHPVSKDQIQDSVAQSSRRFNFMFDRFLVAQGFLGAEKAIDIDLPLPASLSRVVLSLPETVARRRVLEENMPARTQIFDGIRRQPGWIGCGLSYQVLAHHAVKANLDRLTVMEDDVLMSPDFEQKFKVVEDYLALNPQNWDVFVGVIAAIHPDTEILKVESFRGQTFVTISKMTSMVFNVYSRKALHLLESWDPRIANAETNTIDRFLQSQETLKIVLTLPFLVGHREEVHSTLWGFQNHQYSQMIQDSEALLTRMAGEFSARAAASAQARA